MTTVKLQGKNKKCQIVPASVQNKNNPTAVAVQVEANMQKQLIDYWHIRNKTILLKRNAHNGHTERR